MRRLLTGLGLVMGILWTAAALAAAPAQPATADEAVQIDELYHALVEFRLGDEVLHSEELTGAGRQLVEVGIPEAGPLETYRFATVVQARNHDIPPGEDVTAGLYTGSAAFTAALQRAQRLTVNGVDLAVYHPGADTCRITVWWTYYSVIGGRLVLDEAQPVTREARTAEIILNTPATSFFDDGSAEQYEHVLHLIRAPEFVATEGEGDAAGLSVDTAPLISPLDVLQIDGVTFSTSGETPADRAYPHIPDTRPLAVYGDRIVRYDQSVLEDRMLYFITLAFYRDGEHVQTNSLSVMDQPLPVLFSSIYWYAGQAVHPGWPEPREGTYPAEVNYLVRLRSQDTGELLSPGYCIEDLPDDLASALDYFTFGGLRFEVYYPGVDRVEVAVSRQLIPGHVIEQVPGELVPVLKSVPPGETVDLGTTSVGLANPELGQVDLPTGTDPSHLGVISSATVLEVTSGI